MSAHRWPRWAAAERAIRRRVPLPTLAPVALVSGGLVLAAAAAIAAPS